MDYKVRGFTRDTKGRKHFIDHRIHSIQEYIRKTILERYQRVDINIYQENLFHTKMLLKDLDLNQYLFATTHEDLTSAERSKIKAILEHEMTEIFYSKNVYHT
jgi:S-adenosylmethionine decarboxylase